MIDVEKCECENALHFEKHNPNRVGSPYTVPHHYGAPIYQATDSFIVLTDYGKFRLCRECASAGHMIDRKDHIMETIAQLKEKINCIGKEEKP